MADGPEDFLAPEAILDAIVLDDALPELLGVVAVILGSAVNREEGTDDARQHMDYVHVLPSPTDRRVGPVRGARTLIVTPKTSAPAGIRGVQVKVAPAPPAFVTDTES